MSAKIQFRLNHICHSKFTPCAVPSHMHVLICCAHIEHAAKGPNDARAVAGHVAPSTHPPKINNSARQTIAHCPKDSWPRIVSIWINCCIFREPQLLPKQSNVRKKEGHLLHFTFWSRPDSLWKRLINTFDLLRTVHPCEQTFGERTLWFWIRMFMAMHVWTTKSSNLSHRLLCNQTEIRPKTPNRWCRLSWKFTALEFTSVEVTS